MMRKENRCIEPGESRCRVAPPNFDSQSHHLLSTCRGDPLKVSIIVPARQSKHMSWRDCDDWYSYLSEESEKPCADDELSEKGDKEPWLPKIGDAS